MAELPTQYTNRNVSSITDHSRTNSDTLSTDPALEHQPAALDGGNLEKGGSNSSASPGIGARLKGLLPTKARRQNFTWKHYTLYALVLLVPIIIIALALGLTLGRKHKTPFRSTLPPVEVDLGYTQYQGAMLPSGINQWLGMRYAAPPLGELRFKAPQDPPKARKQSAIEVCSVADPFSGCPLTFYSTAPSATLLRQPVLTPRIQRTAFSLMCLLLLTQPLSSPSISSFREAG